MPWINHVNTDKINETGSKGRSDPQSVKRTMKLEGKWVFDNEQPQFVTELAYENGKQGIEIDSPTFMGGNGSRLGPMQYCIAGIASCFLSTVVTVATVRNVKLKSASISAECQLNFGKTFDISNDPITESVNFKLNIDGDADRDKLNSIIREAEQKCPAVYSLTHQISVNSTLG